MKYIVSKNIIDFILSKTGGFLTNSQYDLFFDAIEKETEKYYFTESSEANLIRIFSSIFDIIYFIQ